MIALRYHEAVLRILEQHRPYDWERLKSGLQRHEAWIKSLSYINTPGMPGFGADRCYCKWYCCGLLQRSLQLYMQTAGQERDIRTSAKDRQKASWALLVQLMTLGELIRSLEAIYQHFGTINDIPIKM